MKRNGRLTSSTTIVIAALFCCMTLIVTSPLTSAEPGTAASTSKPSKTDRIEMRINDLHSKLKITPEQEEQWNKVAQAMRDNANAMQSLIEARKAQGTNLNAVDDLKAYAKIQDAHAAGLNNFINAFEPLYASMSDEQKKTADALFTKHGKHHKKSKKK